MKLERFEEVVAGRRVEYRRIVAGVFRGERIEGWVHDVADPGRGLTVVWPRESLAAARNAARRKLEAG